MKKKSKGMTLKSIDRRYPMIIILIIAILLMSCPYSEYNKLIRYIGLVIGVLGILITVVDGCYSKKKKRNSVSYYDFNLINEYEIYRNIGRKTDNSTSRFEKYSEWKKYIEKKDCVRSIDFDRFINRKLRLTVVSIDTTKTVFLPVELGAIALMINYPANDFMMNFFSGLVGIILLVICVFHLIYKMENEKNFLIDLREIINDELKKSKYDE